MLNLQKWECEEITEQCSRWGQRERKKLQHKKYLPYLSSYLNLFVFFMALVSTCVSKKLTTTKYLRTVVRLEKVPQFYTRNGKSFCNSWVKRIYCIKLKTGITILLVSASRINSYWRTSLGRCLSAFNDRWQNSVAQWEFFFCNSCVLDFFRIGLVCQFFSSQCHLSDAAGRTHKHLSPL